MINTFHELRDCELTGSLVFRCTNVAFTKSIPLSNHRQASYELQPDCGSKQVVQQTE